MMRYALLLVALSGSTSCTSIPMTGRVVVEWSAYPPPLVLKEKCK